MKSSFFTSKRLMRTTHWLICIMAFLLIIASCKKDEVSKPRPQPRTPKHLKEWPIAPVVDTTESYMVFATRGGKTATYNFVMTKAANSDSPIWFDLNNNGLFDATSDVQVNDTGKLISIISDLKVFTVYGEISEFTTQGNNITASDVRTNKHLNKINISENNLDEAAFMSLAQNLPQPAVSGKAVIIARNANLSNEHNKPTDKVVQAAENRGWKVHQIKNNKEETFVGLPESETNPEVEPLPTPDPTPDPTPNPDPSPDPTPNPSIPDTEAPKPGRIIQAQATAPDKITASWSRATDNVTAADKLVYKMICQPENGGDQIDSGDPKKDLLKYELTGLTPNTLYRVWVLVGDEANNYYHYDFVRVSTLAAPKTDEEAPVPGEITKATATAFDKIKLSWSAAKDNITPADKLTYKVVWINKEASTYRDSGIARTNFFEYEINGLTENTTYLVFVLVEDEAENTAPYYDVEISTPAKNPIADREAPKPGVIKSIQTESTDKATIEWTPATDNVTKSDRLTYRFYWQREGSSTPKSFTYEHAFYRCNLSLLSANTTYKVWVTVTDEAGNTATYGAKEFTTAQLTDTTPPTPGRFTQVQVLSDKEAFLSWTEATDDRTPQQDLIYTIYWLQHNTKEIKSTNELRNKKPNGRMHSLEPNTSYSVWIVVRDAAGNKANYDIVEFTTLPEQDPPVNPTLNPQAKIVPNATDYVIFHTKTAKGKTIEVNENSNTGWADLNNNGAKDPTDTFSHLPSSAGKVFIVDSPTIVYYGDFSLFRAANNQIDYLDFSHCLNISYIDISRNNLKLEAMLAVVKSLPKRSAKNRGTIVLQDFSSNEINMVDVQIARFLESKNWDAKYYDKDHKLKEYTNLIIN